MPTQQSFDYAVIRVVPRVEREEFLNAGVIVFCPEARFLAVRTRLDERRLLALSPDTDLESVRRHLEAYVKIGKGDQAGGPVAALGMRERFHWLVAPRSTMIQVSPVHTGLCDEPEKIVEHLYEALL